MVIGGFILVVINGYWWQFMVIDAYSISGY
jgi:hypothetical protein